MNKEDYRKYLEKIFKYLNVSAICSLYNKNHPCDKIDYTNLNRFVKHKDYDKISLNKLEIFIYFIKQNIGMELLLEDDKEKHIERKTKRKMKKDLIQVIKEFEEI